jgi:plastocyanin
MRISVLVLPALMLGVMLGLGLGRAAESPPTEPAQPSQPLEVTIRIVMDAQSQCDKAYDPAVVTIKAGMTVVWINQDYETHTLVSSEGNDPCQQMERSPEDRVIDAGQLPPRKEYRKTFKKPGEYPYTCHLPFHHMSGRIIVVP